MGGFRKRRVLSACLACCLLLAGMGVSCTSVRREAGERDHSTPFALAHEEERRVELYVAAMREAFAVENGGSAFLAVKLDTLVGAVYTEGGWRLSLLQMTIS